LRQEQTAHRGSAKDDSNWREILRYFQTGLSVGNDRKLYFNILDYTGSATRLFADPDFDGEPAYITEQEMNQTSEIIKELVTEETSVAEQEEESSPIISDDFEGTRRKYYFDGGQVEIAAHLVHDLDPDGKQLRVVKFSQYAADKVRTLYSSAADLRKQWANPMMRA
jgi:type I restriction enzyme R subunit